MTQKCRMEKLTLNNGTFPRHHVVEGKRFSGGISVERFMDFYKSENGFYMRDNCFGFTRGRKSIEYMMLMPSDMPTLIYHWFWLTGMGFKIYWKNADSFDAVSPCSIWTVIQH